MKVFLWVLSILMVAGVCVSCSSGGGGGGSPSEPDIDSPDGCGWFDNYPVGLGFEGNVAVVCVFAEFGEFDPNSVELEVNDVDCNCQVEDVNSEYTSFYAWGVYLGPGETAKYKLKVGNKSYKGSIRMPDVIDLDCPPFYDDKNYTFEWETARDPWKFLVHLSFHDEYDDSDYFSVLVPGKTRSYTARKSLWDDLDGDVDYWVELIAVNYKLHSDDCLVLSMEAVYSDECRSSFNTAATTASWLKLFNLIRANLAAQRPL